MPESDANVWNDKDFLTRQLFRIFKWRIRRKLNFCEKEIKKIEVDLARKSRTPQNMKQIIYSENRLAYFKKEIEELKLQYGVTNP